RGRVHAPRRRALLGLARRRAYPSRGLDRAVRAGPRAGGCAGEPPRAAHEARPVGHERHALPDDRPGADLRRARDAPPGGIVIRAITGDGTSAGVDALRLIHQNAVQDYKRLALAT